MPDFTFKAYSRDGGLLVDRITAANQVDAVRLLATRGLVVFEVKSAQPSVSARRARLPLRTLAVFCRQMATMSESDLPIDEALALLANDSDRKSAALAARLREAVMQGATLSAALSAYPAKIPDFMIGLVAAGEAGGALAPVFNRLADDLEGQIRMVETLRSALIYPAVLGITAIVSLVVVLTVVSPALAPVFAGAGDKTPFSARLLISASETLRDYWWAGVISILVALLVLLAALRSPGGRVVTSRLALSVPLIGPVITSTETSRFLGSLAALLDNGVSIVPALEITRGAAGNAIVAADIDRIASRVRLGGRLGDAMLQSEILSGLAGRMASVGERSGQLEAMLWHGARLLEEATQRDVKRLMAVAAPALTLLLGLLVGGVVLSLLGAIMSVNDLAIIDRP